MSSSVENMLEGEREGPADKSGGLCWKGTWR